MLDGSVIWWQVFPLGATGAQIRQGGPEASGEDAHRILRLEPWLDYLIEIGCSGLLLGPVFSSVSHGYDTLDHFRLDPRLGDDADAARLISACRERGIHVMLDGVFNHVARSHPRVEELGLRKDGELVGWEGHDELVTLDHSKQEVEDLVVEVMLHWLGLGIAGWRLDVAYAVPVDFWNRVTARVREHFPAAMFLGEVIHGDYAGIVREGGLDTVTQYELWKAIWSSIKDVNFWELAWALERHAEMCEIFLPQTFVSNHDVTRIASEVGEEGAAVAAAILLTVPGMPSIYYGDERAVLGAKGEGFGADDELRPLLPATPQAWEGANEWLFNHYKALVSIRRRLPWITTGTLSILSKTNETISYRVVQFADEYSTREDDAPANGGGARADDAAGADAGKEALDGGNAPLAPRSEPLDGGIAPLEAATSRGPAIRVDASLSPVEIRVTGPGGECLYHYAEKN